MENPQLPNSAEEPAQRCRGGTESESLLIRGPRLVLICDRRFAPQGALLDSVDANGADVQTEGELHGAAAGDHPLPG